MPYKSIVLRLFQHAAHSIPDRAQTRSAIIPVYSLVTATRMFIPYFLYFLFFFFHVTYTYSKWREEEPSGDSRVTSQAQLEISACLLLPLVNEGNSKNDISWKKSTCDLSFNMQLH